MSEAEKIEILLKLLSWLIGIAGTFLMIGFFTLVRMNRNIQKILTFIEVQKEKNANFEKNYQEIKENYHTLKLARSHGKN